MTKTKELNNKHRLFWLLFGLTFLTFLYLIRAILLPFVLSISIAYLLNPAVTQLQKRGFPRGAATLLMIVCFFLAVIEILLLVVPLAVGQLSGLLSMIPSYLSDFQQQYAPQLQQWLGGLPARYADSAQSALTNISGIAIGLVQGFVSGVLHSGMALVNLLSLILITPVVAFYLLNDWNKMTARFHTLLPRAYADTISGQITLIEKTLDGFVRGQLTVCCVLACYYATGLSLTGLNFGMLIGIVTGLLVVFPYMGLLLGMITGMSIALFQFEDYGHIGAVLAVFLVGQCLEGYFLTPRLVGKSVGLHPVWIIFGMLSGAALFGFVGVLLAVPTTAVIGVLIRFIIDRYLHSSYYK